MGCTLGTHGIKTLENYSLHTKSDTYFPAASEEENRAFVKGCFMSRFQFIHLVGHFLMALVFPHFIGTIWITTALFELYEYVGYRCHDVTDLLYNTIGLALGVAVGNKIRNIK